MHVYIKMFIGLELIAYSKAVNIFSRKSIECEYPFFTHDSIRIICNMYFLEHQATFLNRLVKYGKSRRFITTNLEIESGLLYVALLSKMLNAFFYVLTVLNTFSTSSKAEEDSQRTLLAELSFPRSVLELWSKRSYGIMHSTVLQGK